MYSGCFLLIVFLIKCFYFGYFLWEGDYVFLNKLTINDDIFNIRLIYENDKFIRSEDI